MSNYKNRVVFTGGTGRFGKVFKKKEKDTKFKFYFPSKKELNILNLNPDLQTSPSGLGDDI